MLNQNSYMQPSDLLFYKACFLLISISSSCRAADAPGIQWSNNTKSVEISSPYRGSEIIIRVSSRNAGAIDSLKWRGKEFVNSSDHGREIQSAAAFSNSRRECHNPTEAGSKSDGAAQISTSRLLILITNHDKIVTRNQMAYWIDPGDFAICGANERAQDGPISPYFLEKSVLIGANGLPNVIQYDTTFYVPGYRTLGGFEAPTGYMQPDFNYFWTYEPVSDQLHLVSKGIFGQNKETIPHQHRPLILSTSDKQYALGICALPQVNVASYSAWHFTKLTMASPTVKWTCFFQIGEVLPGKHSFSCYFVVGSLDDVRSGLHQLCNPLNRERGAR